MRSFSSLKSGILEVSCDQETVELVENPDYISKRTDTFVLLETGMELWQNQTNSFEHRKQLPGKSRTQTQAEWMEVKCGSETNYHIQNVKNESVIDRLNAANAHRDPAVTRMNLMVIMMDTVSRAQVFRKMPKTVAAMERINATDNFEVFQFFRLVANGFATEMNTKAMYTGSLNRRERSGRPYWDILRSQGNAALYINGFCEDWMSTFLKKPFAGADHFAFLQWCHPDYHPYERTFGNFAGPFSILRRCIRGRHVHNRIFDYVKDYWRNYQSFGKVVHIPLQEGHEGTGEVVLTLDQDLAEFFEHMKDTGELNKTVLILTSDHGSHMGPYYMSGGMGEFEQKLPLLLMTFPQWFLSKYPEFRPSLLAHEQALISHYDTHWTIRHLATLPEFGGDPCNYEADRNQFVDVWDCVKNRDYMEVVYQFRGKVFTRGVNSTLTHGVLQAVEDCFYLLDYTPQTLNRSTVPLGEIATSVTDVNTPFVEDAITDKFAYYWFLDAAKYIELYSMKYGQDFRLDGQSWLPEHAAAETEAWSTLRAPGRGRFMFGRSMLRYSEERDCREAGIPACVCASPLAKQLRGNEDYR